VIDIRLWLAAVWATAIVAFCLGLNMDQYYMSYLGLEVLQPMEASSIHSDSSTALGISTPTGQHLVIDMNGVDTDFLKSEERLVTAMKDTAKAVGFDSINYNCNSALDGSQTAISCISIFSQAHLSFYAWPENGVIALDLFATDESIKSLVTTVNVINDFFSIGQDVEVFWSIDYRGHTPSKHTELAKEVLSPKIDNIKRELLNIQTKKHHVIVYEGVDLDQTILYEKVLEYNLKPDDPRWTTNELVEPEREAFVDGRRMYSEDSMDEILVEVSVHPFLTLHPNPRHIASGKKETIVDFVEYLVLLSIVFWILIFCVLCSWV